MNATKSADKKQSQIGKPEALEILQSALNYCHQSGLVVQAGNANGGFTIILQGVTINGDRLVVTPVIIGGNA